MKKNYFILLLILAGIKIQAQSWVLVWSDEFAASKIDTASWNYETGGGGWGNSELENYTKRPDNAIVENGSLNIIAKKETYGGSSYTSARMTTKAKHYITYGRVEARIKMMSQKGLWPAFWMLGENISQVGWPKCGEIDIMEHVNKDTDMHGTIHWDNNGHAQYGGSIACTVTDYHVYSIEWDSTTIRWMLDGTEYFNANIKNNINSTDEFHNPFFVILNVAVGGSWPGNPDGTSVFPDTMSVDYVRFYQLKNVVNPPTPIITSSGSLSICQGDSVTLTCSTATSYLWSTSETTQSITVKTAGNYTVSVGDGTGGNTASDTTIVIVNALPPVPTITETGGGGVPNSPPSVLHSSSSTGNQWYFKDTIIVNETFASLSPQDVGDFSVMVTDSNGCKSLSLAYNYIPKPTPPGPTTISTPTVTSNGSLTICQGDSVMLTCSTANSYIWSTLETTQSISVKDPGAYIVSISDGSGGNAVSDSTIVIVNTLPPVPTITESGGGGVGTQPNVLHSSSSTGNQWYLNDSIILNENSASFTPSQIGDYSVRVIDNNGCGSVSLLYNWTPKPSPPPTPTPTPTITANGSLTICEGDSLILTSSAAASYLWSTTATTQSIIVKSSGSYSLTITDSLGSTASSDSVFVAINASPPIPTITETGGGGVPNSPPSVLHSSSSTRNQWYLNDSILSGADQSTYSPGGFGDYTVLVKDNNGCKSTSMPYTWFPKPTSPPPGSIPTPTVTASSALTICAGDSVMLTSSIAASYVWSNLETTRSITVKDQGNYAVTTGDGLGGSSVSDSVFVKVNALPAIPTITESGGGVSTSPAVLHSSSSTGNQWYWSYAPIAGANSQTYLPTQSGSYMVEFTDVNGCKAMSEEIIMWPVGIEEITKDNVVQIIPNPSNGVFKMETKGLKVLEVKIYTTLGEIIYGSKNSTTEMDLSTEPSGTYFMEMYFGDKIVHKKLLIQ